MSRTADYYMILDEVTDAAEDAAHHPDVNDRMHAMRYLLNGIGEAVGQSRFYDPTAIAAHLVRLAVDTYVSTLRELIADRQQAAA
ncbi:hypothetical protein [Streptomyces noursei]|uniref:hypothetical protein n=1 Tax=Streptomyces noursei TaxID=1971 RepID=UPI0016796E5E|nr:hypothetical protein [Streptomyces noursei]MCZ1019382.1 hypothetical protein [Streptomyces noursei]GGX08023.1 hypothetical protein GCM10010341_32030 [Streptomyces noursei]